MRLHRRMGIYLVLWPAWWGILFVSKDFLETLYFLGLFFIGAVVMRSAGCVINDIWDRDIDSRVERTKMRPLARGDLTIRQAGVLLFILLLTGLILLLSLQPSAQLLGVIFVCMIVVYPLMKRVMAIPQIFLGLTINAGALIAVAAINGALDLSAGFLYMGCFFWTLGYDTIYAYQDKQDDKKIGIYSSALFFGQRGRIFILVCYALMTVSFVTAGFFSHQPWLYHIGIAVAFFHLLWQGLSVNLDDPVHCMRIFRSNNVVGWSLFLALFLTRGVE